MVKFDKKWEETGKCYYQNQISSSQLPMILDLS